MEKKSLKVLAILFLIVLGVVLFLILNDKKTNNSASFVETEDSLKFKEEYESVNDNDNAVQINIDSKSPIKYLLYSDFKSKLQSKESFVLYLGFPTCPWCRNIINVLLDIAKSNNNTVYYMNVRELKNTEDDYKDLYDLLSDYLTTNSEGVKTLYVPDVYFFKDGKIVGNHLGSVDSQTNPSVLLDNNQQQELENIYQDLFNKLK